MMRPAKRIDDLGLASVLQHASSTCLHRLRAEVLVANYVVDATGCNRGTISMTKAPQPKTLEAQLTGPGGHRIQAK